MAAQGEKQRELRIAPEVTAAALEDYKSAWRQSELLTIENSRSFA